jgi:hypothetical protein
MILPVRLTIATIGFGIVFIATVLLLGDSASFVEGGLFAIMQVYFGIEGGISVLKYSGTGNDADQPISPPSG